ncbi:DEAD/DEAH box helicase family protein [Saccharopolyspora gloriosae]|uniref:DEAD/DEAH box helicase family protein n=1 Tax=Saccharopolyspora gloriosae TaxID=455344 RepID=UPI001FB61F24|nr:DEAD/DEAH box helicase family protein [Saccharopolyspora gloriosae]
MKDYGHDSRRRLSPRERQLVYERADGRCQRCGAELGPAYQNAHLAANRNGGATEIENMQAWCARCNLGLGGLDADSVPNLILREWQCEALRTISETLFQDGVATLHAAPGAGKTICAGVLFKILRDAGYVERMVVVVPNKALVRQWRKELALLRIHVDSEPVDGAIEHTGKVGAIVSYQSLPGAAPLHEMQQARRRTLVVLDEVHHVATDASWGLAVQSMIGDVTGNDLRAEAVLNMTGTLFRSSPKRRISTVRYEQVHTGEVPKLQAVADYSVLARELIHEHLRPPDLYAYGGRARFVDVVAQREVHADIADLEESPRNSVLLQACTSGEWLRGFAAEAVRLLENQLRAIEYAEPLKLLFVAPTQEAARSAALALNRVTGRSFARLVTSDEPGALDTLRLAAQENRSCGIVAVRMITEGFDCPQVSTIAYATNVTAPLFISQMMARAMRVTVAERERNTPLPANILVPDHPVLCEAFAAALANTILPVDDRESAEFVPKDLDAPSNPRYELLGLDAPWFSSARALEQPGGPVSPREVEAATAICEKLYIPVVLAPRVALGFRDWNE